MAGMRVKVKQSAALLTGKMIPLTPANGHKRRNPLLDHLKVSAVTKCLAAPKPSSSINTTQSMKPARDYCHQHRADDLMQHRDR